MPLLHPSFSLFLESHEPLTDGFLAAVRVFHYLPHICPKLGNTTLFKWTAMIRHTDANSAPGPVPHHYGFNFPIDVILESR